MTQPHIIIKVNIIITKVNFKLLLLFNAFSNNIPYLGDCLFKDIKRCLYTELLLNFSIISTESIEKLF